MCSQRVAYPNFLLKATRAMASFTPYPYQSVMTIFMNMRIKGTNSSWSFHTPGLGRTSAQFWYTTPLFLNFTNSGIGPHSWYVKVYVWRESNANIATITRKLSSKYSMSSTLGFNIATSINTQIFTHTNIFTYLEYVPALQIKIYNMQYI